MSAERVAYRYPHVVAKVEEGFKVVSFRADANGKPEPVLASTGWFVTLQPGGIGYPVGPEKPALNPGDRVELVLRPADPPADPAPALPVPNDPAPSPMREAAHVG